MARKVLVISEAREGVLRNVSFEVIAAGTTIAEGGEVVGVLLGENISSLGQSLISQGANRVIVVENDKLATYTPDCYSQALLEVIEKEQPEAIVLGHTSIGKDISPKIASVLQSGLISDVIDVEVLGENVVFTRPIYSGKAFEKKISTDGTIFATIRPNNIAPLEEDATRVGEITPIPVPISDLRTIVRDVLKKATQGIDLSEAKVVVAGGRGVKSAAGFKPLQELAEVLGGAVGASRGACDADYCDYAMQIGQTGKVVTPDLYIACGISGAIQHLAGMSNSKVIVAINKDPEANIFQVADYGIVGDLFEVVPVLTEELKKLKVSL